MDEMNDHASEHTSSRSSSFREGSPTPSTPSYELNNLRSGRYGSVPSHDSPGPALNGSHRDSSSSSDITTGTVSSEPFDSQSGRARRRPFQNADDTRVDTETCQTHASTAVDNITAPTMDVANYPPAELLKMLATLLQHIATSNDHLRPENKAQAPYTPVDLHARPNLSTKYNQPHLMLNDPKRPTTTTAALATLNAPNSTLCFHARHVPSISIEAYLLRILKYCPVTNDVFLSLLVYFDRLSRVGAVGNFPGEPEPPSAARRMDDGSSEEDDMDTEQDESERVSFPGIRGFAIDSYNVHRLIIAGITVASKFFSDVFYTNARYAKVGGLAVHELNQLELHFLLLTDFRLTIPMAEIQQYGDQLLAYVHDQLAMDQESEPVRAAGDEPSAP